MLVGEIFGAKYGRELAESIALDHITADHEEEVRHRNNLTKGVNSETARKDSGAWSNKGNSLSRLGRFDEAIECYDKALKINPQNANTWARKGLVEEKLDSKLEAAKSYRKVIELAPANDKITQLARQRLRELEGSFSSAEDPMQVLKLRLTKGEITQQEYRDCVELLKQ
jgi:tetratricopeptide (TPR) repeat protein